MSQQSARANVTDALLQGMPDHWHDAGRQVIDSVFDHCSNLRHTHPHMPRYALPMARWCMNNGVPANPEDFTARLIAFLLRKLSEEIDTMTMRGEDDPEAACMAALAQTFLDEYQQQVSVLSRPGRVTVN